jgi:hypothetical protein
MDGWAVSPAGDLSLIIAFRPAENGPLHLVCHPSKKCADDKTVEDNHRGICPYTHVSSSCMNEVHRMSTISLPHPDFLISPFRPKIWLFSAKTRENSSS